MKIVLAYERRPELVDDIHLFDGYLMDGAIKYRLNGKTFAELIFAVSEIMKGHSHNELFIIRLEQPSVEHPISEEDTELIRTRPQQYIEAVSLPPQRIVLRMKDVVEVRDEMKTNVRAGIDTLVESFGENIYSRMHRGGATECPRCGRWKASSMKGVAGYESNIIITRCSSCDFFAVSPAWFLTSDGGWVAFYVGDLLRLEATKTPRFFFPRAWNTSGPWITREDLQNRYDKYVEEKENADRNS